VASSRATVQPADEASYGKDAWHVMNPDGTRFSTFKGRAVAEQRAAKRTATLKGKATKQANKGKG